MYRPLNKYQNPPPRTSQPQPVFLFDSTAEFERISAITKALEQLKLRYEQKYQQSIANLDSLTETTKNQVFQQLKQLQTEFKQDALQLLDQLTKSTVEILQHDCQDLTTTLQEKINQAETELLRAKDIQRGDKGEQGIAGINGKDGLDGQDGKDGVDGKDAVVNEDKIIDDVFSKLLNKKLEISHIKNLEQTLRSISSKIMLGGKGGGGGMTFQQATPTGTINGVNADFTLPTHNFGMLFLNGQLQTTGEDYTLAGLVATFVTAPLTGSVLRFVHA